LLHAGRTDKLGLVDGVVAAFLATEQAQSSQEKIPMFLRPRIRCAACGVAVIAVLACTASALTQTTQPAKPTTTAKTSTLENLQTAYDGESNAHARYVEFAKKADEEGFAGVASLFRATARAEEIHAQRHGEAIKKLGGTPKADVKKPEVKSTRENLEAALKGETYERDTMYPEFLKQAMTEKNKDAVTTLNAALMTEAEHAKFYKEALDNLDGWKAAKRDFFVCSVCGFTVKTIDFEKCPICYSPKEKYEKIN
jgi:rubrerythrin